MKYTKVWGKPFNSDPIMDGHARGRKIHLTKDGVSTLCKLEADGVWEENHSNNGICKNCLIIKKNANQ